MSTLYRLVGLSLLLISVEAQEPRRLGADITEEFVVADGIEVRRFAESPQLYNPSAMDVDARGRLWVTEAVNYRQWRGRNPGRTHPEGDRVVILEDTDGDGACDSTKVFVQDKDLVAPLGICVLGRQVLVSCSPKAILYTDTDGDDVADRKEVFLEGFGGHDHDHGLHSFVVGPDGRWYANVGNAGPHEVRDLSGAWVRSGSLYSGGGEHEVDNRPGLRGDDGRLWIGGLVMGVEPDGTALTVLGHNFRNPYEVAPDAFGNLWQSDNDDDGNQGCRTTWVMEGGNYGYCSADGSRFWGADKRAGQTTQTAHWHQDDPGVCPAGCINGAGGPTGVAVYEGGLWPADFDGTVLNCDAGRNVVYAHRPKRNGAGYDLEPGHLIAARLESGSRRDQRWFRPSDVLVGTDGAIYVADWYDPGVGGHLARDAQAYGRILRLAPKGAKPLPRDLSREGPEGAKDALRNPAVNVRWAGWQRLAEMKERALPHLEELLSDPSVRIRARGIWLLARAGVEGRARVRTFLASVQPSDLRVTAFRALRRVVAKPELLELCRTSAADDDPALRREVALALRDIEPSVKLPILKRLAGAYQPGDRHALEALGLGAEACEDALFVWLTEPDGTPIDPIAWDARIADLAWRLHPKSAVSALATRARSLAVDSGERRRSVDALAFIPEREAGDAMVTLTLAGPPDVQAIARAWVYHRDGNDWRTFALARELGKESMGEGTLVWTSGLLERGSSQVDVDVTGAESLTLLVTEGQRGNGYDWVDWIAPRLVSDGEEIDLTTVPWVLGTTGWGSLLVGKNTGGGPLSLAGKTFERGIGAHAPSRITWPLPAKRRLRFKALAVMDDGGTGQPGARPDVEFQVLLRRPPDRGWIAEAKKVLVDEQAPRDARESALEKLAAHREGGLLVLALASRLEFPKEFARAASAALARNPDLAVRALATARFPRETRQGTSLPSLDALTLLDGDAARGQGVFFGATASCSKCHRVRGRGGDVGPDLSEIRVKFARKELLDAILNPSAAIAFGYDAWLIGTEDDELYSGFILADGATVVVKDTDGTRKAIPRSAINFRRKETHSIMPDDVALGLSAQDLADLAAFLEHDPKKPVAHAAPVDLFNGRDLTGWTEFPAPAEGSPPVWSVVGGHLRCSGSPAGYLQTVDLYRDFVLTLEWRFPKGGRPGNSGVLLRKMGRDQVWPKSIEAQLQHRNAGDIWNIGNYPMEVDLSRTEGRHTRKLLPSNEVPLGEWNTYEITLSGEELTLVVNGRVQNRATWCEVRAGHICLQSEGSVIEFRNVRLR